MDTQNPLEIAKKRLGLVRIAEICGVSREAARKWLSQGFLPRTEWTGETNYAELIAAAYQRAVAGDPQPGLEPAEILTAERLLSVKPTAQRVTPAVAVAAAI